jgi:hypothetical protein
VRNSFSRTAAIGADHVGIGIGDRLQRPHQHVHRALGRIVVGDRLVAVRVRVSLSGNRMSSLLAK